MGPVMLSAVFLASGAVLSDIVLYVMDPRIRTA